jgi:hypothetical protein
VEKRRRGEERRRRNDSFKYKQQIKIIQHLNYTGFTNEKKYNIFVK